MTEIRSGSQYEFLIALSLIEKARYFAEAAQQLSYENLQSILPVLRKNHEILKSISLNDFESDYFILNLRFSLRLCLISYEKIVHVASTATDNQTLHALFSANNNQDTLNKLCQTMDSIWKEYWFNFHNSTNKRTYLQDVETSLVNLYSDICIRGNESFENSYRCPSCMLNSAYLKTGITDECNREDNQEHTSCQQYCYHFIDVKDTSKFFNVDRIIFERRMNEEGTVQE